MSSQNNIDCDPLQLTQGFSPLVRDSGLSFIEHLRISSQKPCLRPARKYILGKDPEKQVAILMQPTCKTWNCPSCAARNARRWIARIINGVNNMDGDWWMFTVTAHEKMRGAAASVKNLREGWKKLYDRAREKHDAASYCKVWEMHGDGKTFHLHGLVDCDWGSRWLKDNSRQCGMGYQTEVHEVDNAGQVAGYIAKYFLKSEGVAAAGHTFPKNLRRIEVSRDWLKMPPLPDSERFSWDVYQFRTVAENHADWLQSQGWRVVDLMPEPETIQLREDESEMREL